MRVQHVPLWVDLRARGCKKDEQRPVADVDLPFSMKFVHRDHQLVELVVPALRHFVERFGVVHDAETLEIVFGHGWRDLRCSGALAMGLALRSGELVRLGLGLALSTLGRCRSRAARGFGLLWQGSRQFAGKLRWVVLTSVANDLAKADDAPAHPTRSDEEQREHHSARGEGW